MIKELIVPVITPVKDSRVDIESFKNLINFLINNRVDSIFVLGATGEFLKLSLKEKREIINICTSFVDRSSFLIGVSANTLKETRELIDASNNLKPSAIVLTPMVGQGEVVEKIELALKYSILPIILYNNPAIQNNINLDLSIINKYAVNSKIIGIKDSSSNEDYNDQLIKISPDSFKFFQGSESQFINFPNKEISGLVASSANVYPAEFKNFIKSSNNKSSDKIRNLKNDIKKISPNSIFNIKTLLKEMCIIESNEIYE
ncbi:dihydrodipicolinate synthase family protein [bacterium]|nr:dihydrodipicolinate synthase family protein [bacterium]